MTRSNIRTVGQFVKLPSNFMLCGAKFHHAMQTVGKTSLFLPRKCLEIFSIICK